VCTTTALRQQSWLKDELGLRFDPFECLDAAEEPYLPACLVGHEDFAALWGDWPSFLFAPPGGGKTAFRVRLARACRVAQDGRRVFPLLFFPPRPVDPQQPPEESAFFAELLSQAAQALLLELAYRPECFLNLEVTPRQQVRLFLEQNLPAPLDYYLAQLEESGTPEPIARGFDPTAVGLPNEPSPKRISFLCAALRDTPVGFASLAEPLARLEQMVRLLINHLGYQAVYLLVDGVDNYVRDPAAIARQLQPLFTRVRAWQEQALFVKFFLPDELRPLIEKGDQSLLTPPSKVVIITWHAAMLAQVVQERLRLASEGGFDSFVAISTPDVADQVELRLAEVVHPALPREVIRLVQRVFYEHTRRVGPYGRLEQQDFEAALRWYAHH